MCSSDLVKDSVCIVLRTPTYSVIEAHYARWYPGGGKKRVPAGLRLTPTVLTHWFCGDGSGGGSSSGLRICTNGFEHHEVDRLAVKLSRYGFPAVVGLDGGKPIIRINTEAARKFKREMWRRLPRCCWDKLAGVTPKPERQGRPGRLTRRTVHAIRYGDLKSARYRKLLAVHKVSSPMAYMIRAGRAYVGYDLRSPR